MALLRPSLSLLLPVSAAVVAAVILGGGISLSRQTRVERTLRIDSAIGTFADELQSRLTELESQYERHLARITRTDLDYFFAVQDAIDGVVGVRQISTLTPEGKIDFHLAASDVETIDDLPVPVIDPRERPPGREHVVEVGTFDLFGGGEGESGWIDLPEGLFYFQRVSIRRVVLLVVDPSLVEETMAVALAPWIRDNLSPMTSGKGTDHLLLHDRVLAVTGDPEASPADSSRTLATHFGSWRVQSWDERHTLVTYQRDRLALAAALAFFVLLSGCLAGASVRRALRLAEQRVSFVNRVSHELKTPLTNILLNADLATDGADPRSRQRLARIQEETRRLARLIDNVLAFSRRGPVEAKSSAPVALRPLIEEVTEIFAPSLERRGVAVEVGGAEETHVLVEPDALRQILGNLLSNIEKYAAAGGIARITFSDERDEVILLVSDRGPGILERDYERIFRAFYRLDDRTSEGVTGTGLGLAIARDLAVELGGALRVVSGETPGATFELRLPAVPVAKVISFPDSRAS